MTVDLVVVVITYQSSEHLGACLASVPAGYDVIVIDNASTDGSADLAESTGVRVVRNAHNVGFGRAVDLAFALTDAASVLLLNPDARLRSDTLDELLAAIVPADVGVAASRLVHDDGSEQRSSWPFPSARAMWRESLGTHRFRRKAAAVSTEVHDVEAAVGACMLVKRSAFVAAGGFDERFWLYGEEVDFCKRCRDVGLRTVSAPKAVADHVGGVSSAALGALSRTHFLRGSERFVLHHDGRRALVSYRLGVLLGAALRWPILRARGGAPDKLAVRSASLRQNSAALVHHPTSVPTEPMSGVDELVLLSLEPWDEVWRRNQFLVRELVSDARRTTRVLVVEPPIDVLHELRTHHRLPARRATARPVPGTPGVFAFTPTKVWPRVLGARADRSLVQQVRRAAAGVGFTSPVAWINDSTYAPLIESSGWPTVYDITDDWTREPVAPREHRRRMHRESTMMSESDAIVVCSPELARDRGRQRAVELIPNAVDLDHFRRPQSRPADLPAAPTAVYVGTLHRERVDVVLVARLAAETPGVQFVFVGPDALDHESHTALAGLGNVHILGRRAYSSVPAYLQHADVLVVPHVVTPFTESLDPIKLYECLAVGIATVATPVAGFRGAGEPIVVAAGDEFVSAVQACIASPQPRVDRQVPSWSDRAADFRDVLVSVAGRRS